jgi:PKD repeat protein
LNLNATDSDGDPIEWSITTNASHGTATVSGTGTSKSISYTPSANYNGSDTFTIQISDDLGGTDTMTVNITINPRNDLPVNTVSPTISGIYHYGDALTINNGTWNDDTDLIPGTLIYTYEWQLADDATGSNTVRVNNNQVYTPTLADNGKYIRAQITATDNGEGLPVTQSFTVHTDWHLIENAAPIFAEYSPVHVTMDEDANPEPFKLTLHASDPDADILSWQISSQATLGTAYVEGYGYQKNISYTPDLNTNGTDTFEITITDGIDQRTAIQIIVNIQPINDLPSSADFEVNGFENTAYFFSFEEFNAVFSDIDGDRLERIKITALPENGDLLMNNNPIHVNDIVPADQLSLLAFNPDQNWFGTTMFKFQTGDAESWSITAAEVSLTMISTDSPPVVVNAIPDVSLEINADTYIILLTDVFNDPENDTIIITIHDNTNTDLVNATILNNQLILALQADQSGNAEITIRATANEKSVDDIVSIYVSIGDAPPEIAMPINDMTVFEDASSTTINLTPVFTDPDDDDQAIIKSIAYNDNPALVQGIISGNQLILSYGTNESGSATLIVRATSKGKTVDNVFTVTVVAVDDPPTIATALTDLTVDEDAADQTIELHDLFTDVDNDDNSIQTTLAGNSDTNLLIARVANQILHLSFQANQNGTAEITIMGTSNGLTVVDQLSVTVNAVDDPPVVVNAIDDIAMDINAETMTIGLTDVFFDIDNDTTAIIKTIQNTNSRLVTSELQNNNLVLTHQAGVEGESTLTVNAISNGLEIFDTFVVYVNASDMPPEIQTSIENIIVVEDTTSTRIDLSNVFTDPDNDAIIKTIVSNTNQSLLSAAITGNVLDLIYQSDAFGVAAITVRGTSKGKTVDTSFTVTVTPVDDLPIIVNAIDDQTVYEDAPDSIIDLSSVFTDSDNDDQAIVKTIISNDNESLVKTTINNNQLVLSYTSDAFGTATIVIRGTSGGKHVDDSFMLTVISVDDPPTLLNPLADITANEDDPNDMIDLTDVFSDIDNSDIQLSIVENTNTSLVKATIIDNQLMLSYLANQNGTASMTIRGTSGGLHVDDTFEITVYPVDDPPILANAIADIALDVLAELHTIDLTDVFADIDNTIAKSILSNTNSDFVTASIANNILTIVHEAGIEGETEITIQGISNGVAIEDSFNVYAYASDIAPVIANAIADITVTENAPDTRIDLTSVFTDSDNDSIAKMIVNNTNAALVQATISGNILTLDYQPQISGTSIIDVRGTSKGKFVDDTITVTVLPVDDPPVVVNTINDVVVDEDASDTHIDLSPVFDDPDNETILKSIASNSNESLLSTILTGNQLILSYAANANGTAIIGVRAKSGNQSVDTSFMVTVKPVDDPPVIANAINDINDNEDAADRTIDLSDVFTDIDNYDTNIQLSITNNTNTDLITATIANKLMTLRYQPDQSGTAIITIRGTSNGLFVEDQVKITINAVDDPPVIANALPDIAMNINEELLVIDLTDVFMDIDNSPIIKTIQSNTNTALATASISDDNLIIVHSSGIEGETEITIQAISNGLMIHDGFTIFVNASDQAPEINSPINDIVVTEDAATTTIDLANVFTDPDNDDQRIEKSIVSNTNESMVMASIDGNNLLLSYQPNAFGVANITVRGTSLGKTIENTFTVTVTAIDDPPTMQSAITDIVVDENEPDTNIDLKSVFSDIDNDDTSITISIHQNSNDSLLTASITNKLLTLSFHENQSGEAIITIRGESNGLFIDDTFTVTVNAVDSSPEVLNPIADLSVDMNAESVSIPLNDVFVDPDNDSIVVAIQNNTNPALVGGSIIENVLHLSFTADMEGMAIITISATANEKVVNDAFNVYVNSSDLGPEILTPIENITVLEDAADTRLNLTYLFTDPDNDDQNIEKSILSNTNKSLVSTTLTSNKLILTYSTNASGTATIVIRGTSQGKTVDHAFNVTVAPVDDPPIIANALNDLTVDEDAADQTIDLYDLFTDVDNDDTSIQITLAKNSNTTLVGASISEKNLHLNFNANQNGSSEMTIMGTSYGLTVVDTFFVTVSPVDDPPVVANAIDDIAMDINAEIIVIPLTDVFMDIDNDNDAIIKTIQNNTNGNLIIESIFDNQLILMHQAGVEGQSTLTVKAISNGLMVTDSFNVFVNPADAAPVIARAIEDITVVEGADRTVIDLTNIFTDPDDDDSGISKTIQNNTNVQLVSSIIDGSQLTLIYSPNNSGLAIITVRGNSKGQWIDVSFNVVVQPVDSPPEIANAILDVVLDEDAAPVVISLDNVFTDVDNDNSAIIKTIIENTHTQLIAASIADNLLTITCLPNQNGTAMLFIMAESNGLTVVDQMTIVVNPVDDPPETATLINDIQVLEDAEQSSIDLTAAFVDIDTSVIIYEIQTNTNPSLIHTQVESGSLTLRYASDQNGNAHVVISALANGKTVTQAFGVFVEPVNDAPVAYHSSVYVMEDTPVSSRILATDVEQDMLTVNLVSGPEHGMLTLSNQNFIYLPDADYEGKDSFSFTVSDSQLQSQPAQIDITITPVNDAPSMSEILDQETFESTVISQISMMINDPDSTYLTITALSSDTHLLPLELITLSGGQTIQSNQIRVAAELFDSPVFLTIEPASGQAGTANVTLSIMDDRGLVKTQTFTVLVIKHTIAAVSSGNGAIEPSGLIEVNTGEPFVFTIKPDDGYVIDHLKVDGQMLSARPTYTFWNVMDSHAITAVFREPYHYTITTLAGTGGNIEPNGNVIVQDSMSKTFTIQPDSGYEIDYLRVDNVFVAATNEYRFDTVNTAHSIEAFFKAVPAPIASFIASPIVGNFPLEVSFKETSQNSITSRLWNFGDGTTGISSNPKHTYFKPGNYTVSYTVNGPGGKDVLVKENLIVVQNIQVDFTATPATGFFPLTSTFMPQLNDNVTNVIWHFGDGEISSQFQPTHVYKSPGSYTVQLTAFSSGSSATEVKTSFIKVNGRNISGQVTASDTGLGLKGYVVEVIHRHSGLKVSDTYTDSNGNYAFICEPASLTCVLSNQIPAATDLIVAVWPPFQSNDYYMQYYHGQTLEEKANLVSTLESDQEHIDFILQSAFNKSISGIVHDNGVAQADIEVNAYSEKLSFGLTTQTDEHGMYSLSGLKPSDDYCVYVWDDQRNTEIYFALPETQIPGQDIPTYSVFKWDAATQVEPLAPSLKNIDILLNHDVNTRGTIQGCIVTNENVPAQGIWVYAFSDATNNGNGAFTNENGTYTITGLTQVADTDPYTMGYIVAVHSVQDDNQETSTKLWYTYQAYPNVTNKALAERVKTGAVNIDFTLITQCTLSGTVFDIYGSAIPGVQVQARSDITGQNVSALTDKEGKYAISGLSPVNDYIVTASAVYYPIVYYNGQSTKTTANKVDLSDGDITGINFALDTGYIIQGIVYIDDTNTTASEGLWVNIWSESTRTGGDVPTDINGRYQITGLVPTATDYYITIRKKGYMAAYYGNNHDSNLMNDTVYSVEDASGIAATPLQLSVDRNLIIREGLTISGIVQYGGLPVAGIRVEAWSAETGGWDVDVSSATLTNGVNYKISGLPPGEYVIQIYPIYYQDASYRAELRNTDINNLYFPLEDLENMICGTVSGLDVGKKAQITAWSEGTGFNKTIILTGTGNDIPYSITQMKPSSDYRVKFSGSGYPLQVYDSHTSESDADLIDISDGIVSGIDFMVYSGTQTISGTVNFPGSAVPGEIAWIDAFSQSTGSDGSAEVILIDGNTASYQIKGLKKATDFTVVAWGKQYQEQYFNGQTDASKAAQINTADDIPDNQVNFDLTPGATISGTIYEEGIPVEGFLVLAISDNTNSFGGSTTASDGSYLIDGLDIADDFIIKAQKSGKAPFYYNETATTRDEKLATRVSTVKNQHPTDINIQMAILESIRGTVRDEDGKTLSGIWVNLWSDLQQTGEGMYTADDGTYFIDALPKSNDFNVSIGEHASLTYVPEEKTNVKSGSEGIDFTLRKAYQLKGIVANTSGMAIVKAEVELYSLSENFYVWTKTDGSGTYNIQCLPSANDYRLSIVPPGNMSYMAFHETGIQIDNTTTQNNQAIKDIVLKTASYLSGHVYKLDKTTPIANAKISVYSSDHNYSGVGITDEKGYYIINNIPIGNDYVITVTSNNYAKAVKIDQTTGASVDFALEYGSFLFGKVIEQDGAPLADVLVIVKSKSAHFSGVQRTDTGGTFTVSGLPRYLDNGSEINDFVVTIYPKKYAEQSQGQKRAGETITFVCKQIKIKGSVTDANGSPIPDGVIVAVKIYKNVSEGGFVKKTRVETDGTFTIEGLIQDTDYQIKVSVFHSKMQWNEQWVDQNSKGVLGRVDAGVFVNEQFVDIQLNGTWD